MIKGMMGPEHGAKAAIGSGKAADTRRKKMGLLKTAKLPTSLDDLRRLERRGNISDEEHAAGRTKAGNDISGI